MYEKLPKGSSEFMAKRRELELPAIEVRNTVTHLNPAFKELPFQLKEGEQTPLGIFFIPDEQHHDPESVRHMMIAPEETSGRSGLFPPVIFRDRDGNLYREVDAKGIGAFRRRAVDDGSFYVREPGAMEGHAITFASTYGILDRRVAEYDEKRSEELIRAGIRTYRIIGNADLEEIIDKDGEKISITEAKKRGMIPDSIQPAIEFRAYATRERIPFSPANTERERLAIDDARRLVATELGRDEKDFSFEEYAQWYTKTLGEQIAKLKKYGLYHGYLHYHNLTLDCRIVDLDSVNELSEASKQKEVSEDDLHGGDFDDARTNLTGLWDCLGIEKDKRGYLYDLYEDSYEQELKRKERVKRTFEFLRKKIRS